jgi:hypothetical protein
MSPTRVRLELALSIRRAEDVALRWHHHVVEILCEHRCREKSDRTQRFLTIINEVMFYWCRNGKNAAWPTRWVEPSSMCSSPVPAMMYCVSSVASMCQPSRFPAQSHTRLLRTRWHHVLHRLQRRQPNERTYRPLPKPQRAQAYLTQRLKSMEPKARFWQ